MGVSRKRKLSASSDGAESPRRPTKRAYTGKKRGSLSVTREEDNDEIEDADDEYDNIEDTDGDEDGQEISREDDVEGEGSERIESDGYDWWAHSDGASNIAGSGDEGDEEDNGTDEAEDDADEDEIEDTDADEDEIEDADEDAEGEEDDEDAEGDEDDEDEIESVENADSE